MFFSHILVCFFILRHISTLFKKQIQTTSHNILLIAHPDDESMFFTPFIEKMYRANFKIVKNPNKNNFILSKQPLYMEKVKETEFTKTFLNYENTCLTVLCLSGKNTKREKEIYNICSEKMFNLYVYDFKDGEEWNKNKIALILLKKIRKIFSFKKCKLSIFTFDRYGVSGHKNHISCFNATKTVQKLLLNTQTVYFNYLKSYSLFQKYFICFTSPHFVGNAFNGYKNMAYHKTQLVWYRYLWIFFSNYMTYNTFE